MTLLLQTGVLAKGPPGIWAEVHGAQPLHPSPSPPEPQSSLSTFPPVLPQRAGATPPLSRSASAAHGWAVGEAWKVTKLPGEQINRHIGLGPSQAGSSRQSGPPPPEATSGSYTERTGCGHFASWSKKGPQSPHGGGGSWRAELRAGLPGASPWLPWGHSAPEWRADTLSPFGVTVQHAAPHRTSAPIPADSRGKKNTPACQWGAGLGEGRGEQEGRRKSAGS